MASVLKSLLGRKDGPDATTQVGDGGAPIHVTATTLDGALESDLPVLVDFWAPWCGPCLMLGPAVEDLAREYDGRILVAKLNADEHPEVLERLGIMGIPTLILFKDGGEIARHVGYAPRQVLRDKVEAALSQGG